MTPRTPVTAYSTIGRWHQGPAAPNGSVPGQEERQVTTVEVYTADYYGKGPKLYAEYRTYLQTRHHMQLINIASDGNPERIKARAAAASVTLPEAA